MSLSMDVHRSVRSVLAAALRRVVRRRAPGAGPADTRLHDWTDTELYSVWCATGTELLKAVPAEDAGRTLTASEARRYLITEIERRRPREASAWLTSSSALSGEPPRFLLR
ncbi:hypothetical protein [Kribbella sp. NPDC048915]|uniref:hypothetical protein n=1 Tax=Kribbella sp. NPDC048915 TaxID=3155148 RepID=UPI0033F071BF